MATKQKLIIVILLLLGGLSGWRLYRGWADGSAATGRPANGRGRSIPVETAAPRRATVVESARFSGTLQPRTVFTLAPRVAGRLQSLSVDIGDSVTNGQLIAVIDDEEYVQQLDQARAERDVAAAHLQESISALEIAARDLERIQSLHEQQVVSDTEYDAARARHAAAIARRSVAAAQRNQRAAALAAARTRLSYTRIHAAWEPDGGRRLIGERHVHEGALLAVGQSIVSILDIDSLVAVVTIVERDYPRVAVGQTARVAADALPGEKFDGMVARVAPIIVEQSRQARVEIDLPNRQRRLRPGMFVRAEIVFGLTEDACVVPAAAVARRGGQTGVFQIEPGGRTVRFLPVSIGSHDREQVQILNPPLTGRVVTLGQHLLSDGDVVRIANSRNLEE